VFVGKIIILRSLHEEGIVILQELGRKMIKQKYTGKKTTTIDFLSFFTQRINSLPNFPQDKFELFFLNVIVFYNFTQAR
jgi:hypothetical protein